jgi:hypothetical protein
VYSTPCSRQKNHVWFDQKYPTVPSSGTDFRLGGQRSAEPPKDREVKEAARTVVRHLAPPVRSRLGLDGRAVPELDPERRLQIRMTRTTEDVDVERRPMPARRQRDPRRAQDGDVHGCLHLSAELDAVRR